MKKILIISFSDIKNDPRVLRQVKALSKEYEVETVAYGDSGIEGIPFYGLPDIRGENLASRAILLKTHQYRKYYDRTFHIDAEDKLHDKKFDLILANDNDSLPLAFKIKNGSKVVHDAHEFSPEQQSDDLKWRFFMKGFRTWACKEYLHQCDKMLTVSDGIADRYYKDFGVRPEVITNAADYWDLPPSKLENIVHIIHHGISNPPRKIEKLIEMTKYLDDRFRLSLMLADREPAYTQKLKLMAHDMPKVNFLKPVPAKDIIPYTQFFDIGIFIAEPSNFNLQHTLPNKFFEYIQARLAIAIGPSIEMRKTVEQYDLGVVSDDFTPQSMAKKLNALSTADISRYKENSNKAASILNSEMNMKRLKQIVQEVLN